MSFAYITCMSTSGMKICTRCKRILPIDLFQPPVRICMVCYGGIPGNEHICDNLWELKAKALKSRFAKRIEDHSYAERRYAAMVQNTREKHIRTGAKVVGVEPCDNCKGVMLQGEEIVLFPPDPYDDDTPSKHVCSEDCATKFKDWRRQA